MSKKRIFTEQDIQQIIRWYVNDGFTIHYIATKLLKCRESTISQLLKSNNISIKKQSAGRRFNINEEAEIIDLYVNKNYSQRQIAEKYGCCTTTIHRILIRNNIEIINKPVVNKEQIEDYFDEINTHKKAYWLGFIFADGNVYKNQLSIEIHEKDIDLLKQFKEDLCLNSKISIRHRKNTTVCCIRMVSQHLCDSLAKYGIIPNKTQYTKHLPQIPSLFISDFLRGLIDGDGWISIDKKEYYHIGFVSNYQSICEDFKRYCNQIVECDLPANITKKDNKTSAYCFQVQSKLGTKQLANALYKDNEICLSRKYRLVEPLLDFKNDEDIV